MSSTQGLHVGISELKRINLVQIRGIKQNKQIVIQGE